MKYLLVSLVYMSQKDGAIKVSTVVMSLNSICFCKTFKKSKIAWSLTSRTLQPRHSKNTSRNLQIVNNKRMEKIQILLEVKGLREKNWTQIIRKHPPAGMELGLNLEEYISREKRLFSRWGK